MINDLRLKRRVDQHAVKKTTWPVRDFACWRGGGQTKKLTWPIPDYMYSRGWEGKMSTVYIIQVDRNNYEGKFKIGNILMIHCLYRLRDSWKTRNAVLHSGSFEYFRFGSSSTIGRLYTLCFLCKFVREWRDNIFPVFFPIVYRSTLYWVTRGGTPCQIIEVFLI